MFEKHLASWGLVPDGEPITTHSSDLLPVRREGIPAMLKVAREAEEGWGGLLMAWWARRTARRSVLAHERRRAAPGARHGRRLAGRDGPERPRRRGEPGHVRRGSPAACAAGPAAAGPPARCPRWFEELEPAAARHGGVLRQAAATARELLAEPRDVVVLHGDLHHGNVLDFGPRGWLAIDPKRLVGERGFEFANILRNPDRETATAPGRLARQATVVAEAAGLERARLLKWVLAYAGLSAAWLLGDGEAPELDVAVAEMTASELAQCAR